MWTTIYMATGIENAKEVKEILRNEGFLIKINFVGKENKEDVYELLAPEFEVEDVEEAMIELGIL